MKMIENKIAIIGDSSNQYLSIKLRDVFEGKVEIYESDYGVVHQEIFNTNSGLYNFKPDFVVISLSSEKENKKFILDSREEQVNFALKKVSEIKEFCDQILSQLETKIIFLNYSQPFYNISGHYENKLNSSFLFQLRKLNFLISELSCDIKDLYIVDIENLHKQYGRDYCFDPRMYYNGDFLFSFAFTEVIVEHIKTIIYSIQGKVTKCVILDLDNTLWGGIIGDDGIDQIEIGDFGRGKIFSDFQLWFKKLKERGIILAVCSKNEESIAKEPFEKHPQMVLRLDDIVMFVANWNTKADNIRHIRETLNIGFDSMVFIDDNSFEREFVKKEIKDIIVPDLPEDPAFYVDYLNKCNLFETASISENDEVRTVQYQQELKRKATSIRYANEEEYLRSLNMSSKVSLITKFSVPRIAQLTQRTNQFNFRTIRKSESEIIQLMNDKDFYCRSFELEDEHGSLGIVAVVFLKKSGEYLFIDNLIMSCRAFKRGLEFLILDEIKNISIDNGYKGIIGEFIPTEKNSIIKDFFVSNGFFKENEFWKITNEQFVINKHYINKA